MESLRAMIGKSPYLLPREYVKSLRDECRTMISALEAGHDVDQDFVLPMFKTMEFVANILIFHPESIDSIIFTSEDERRNDLGFTSDDELSHDLEISFVSETLRCRRNLIEFLHLPTSSGGVCRACNWTLTRALRSEDRVAGRSQPKDQS